MQTDKTFSPSAIRHRQKTLSTNICKLHGLDLRRVFQVLRRVFQKVNEDMIITKDFYCDTKRLYKFHSPAIAIGE